MEVGILDEEECWRRLERRAVGRVGFDMGRGLRIHPVNYAVEGRAVLVRTEPGSELARFVDLFSAGGRVAFEVDDVDDDAHAGWSVLVGGSVSAVPDLDDGGGPAHGAPRPWADGDRSLLLRISPTEITGRRLLS